MKGTFEQKLQYFRNGRCGSKFILQGKTFQDAVANGGKYYPTIAKKMFSPSNQVGYETHREALDDARNIRDGIRKRYEEMAVSGNSTNE